MPGSFFLKMLLNFASERVNFCIFTPFFCKDKVMKEIISVLFAAFLLAGPVFAEKKYSETFRFLMGSVLMSTS